MTTKPKPPTPELDKLNACVKQRNTLVQFLEYIQEQGIELASYHKHSETCVENEIKVCGRSEERLFSLASRAGERLVYKFLDLDEKKIEDERQALLESLHE